MLRGLADKLRALLEQAVLRQVEPDLQALMLADGLAMRPGPRPRMDPACSASCATQSRANESSHSTTGHRPPAR